jgi:hypothetical protein
MRARKGATATRPAEHVASEHTASGGARSQRGARGNRQQEVTQLVLHLPSTPSGALSASGANGGGPHTPRRATKSVPELATATPATKPRRARAATSATSATATVPRGEPPVPMSVRRQFIELRAALAEGWEIVQPIFARPLWSAADDRTTAFNFVLSGPHGTRLITVPEGRMVERFIRERQLTVNHVR